MLVCVWLIVSFEKTNLPCIVKNEYKYRGLCSHQHTGHGLGMWLIAVCVLREESFTLMLPHLLTLDAFAIIFTPLCLCIWMHRRTYLILRELERLYPCDQPNIKWNFSKK